MGVFKKLSGNDVRVTPIRTKYSQAIVTPTTVDGNSFDINTKLDRADIGLDTGIDNPLLMYASARQLFYGAFISSSVSDGSIFDNTVTVANTSTGVFSRFDPSFQGSFTYKRDFPVLADKAIKITTISTRNFGESIVGGTVKYSSLIDDNNGNLLDGSGNVKGNIFYDQGVIITTGTNGNGTSPEGNGGIPVLFSGSYTIYSAQYKCTAGPNEFNYSMNPTLLSGSNVDYDLTITDSPDFMPYVTTIGLYNDNQELMMVAKLGKPVQLNPFTDTNFIIRLDR